MNHNQLQYQSRMKTDKLRKKRKRNHLAIFFFQIIEIYESFYTIINSLPKTSNKIEKTFAASFH